MKTVYETGFGLRPPYQILVDGSMCQASLRHKFDLKSRLPIMLGSSTRLLITACTASYLSRMASGSKEPNVTGAPFVGRRLELRRCRHDPTLSVFDCIKDLIGKENSCHYGVASNDERLKEAIRQIPGVPIIYLERVFPLLEAPTKITLEEMRRRERKKLQLSELEETLIKKTFGENDPMTTLEKKQHKRRKAKGPNPLSIKKSRSKSLLGEIKPRTCKRKRPKKSRANEETSPNPINKTHQ